MTIFGHDPLQAVLLIVGIVSALTVGWAVWRAKSAEVAAAAIETWKQLAEGYQERLEQRDTQIAELKAQHAAETAQLQAQLDELRRRLDVAESRDQTAVLEVIRAHEATAAERHAKTIDVLIEIRDTLQEAAPT